MKTTTELVTPSPTETESVESHFSLNTSLQCGSATGVPTVCAVFITNDASSTDDFNWQASSEPNVASVDPSSGVVTLGETSDEITVTVPPSAFCPVTVTFTDPTSHESTSVKVTSINGLPC